MYVQSLVVTVFFLFLANFSIFGVECAPELVMVIDVRALECKTEFGSYWSLYMNDGGRDPSSDSNIFNCDNCSYGLNWGVH